jgi:hypothetical protein
MPFGNVVGYQFVVTLGYWVRGKSVDAVICIKGVRLEGR